MQDCCQGILAELDLSLLNLALRVPWPF